MIRQNKPHPHSRPTVLVAGIAGSCVVAAATLWSGGSMPPMVAVGPQPAAAPVAAQPAATGRPAAAPRPTPSPRATLTGRQALTTRPTPAAQPTTQPPRPTSLVPQPSTNNPNSSNQPSPSTAPADQPLQPSDPLAPNRDPSSAPAVINPGQPIPSPTPNPNDPNLSQAQRDLISRTNVRPGLAPATQPPQPLDALAPNRDPSSAPPAMNPGQPIPSPAPDPNDPNLNQAQRDLLNRTNVRTPLAPATQPPQPLDPLAPNRDPSSAPAAMNPGQPIPSPAPSPNDPNLNQAQRDLLNRTNVRPALAPATQPPQPLDPLAPNRDPSSAPAAMNPGQPIPSPTPDPNDPNLNQAQRELINRTNLRPTPLATPGSLIPQPSTNNPNSSNQPSPSTAPANQPLQPSDPLAPNRDPSSAPAAMNPGQAIPSPTPDPNDPNLTQAQRDLIKRTNLRPSTTPATQPPQPLDPLAPNRDPSSAPAAINPNQPIPSPTPNPNDPNLTQEQRDLIKRTNLRPMTFQSPQAEARFNEIGQRLARMEQKFERTNQEQLRRLGEIRMMPAERQNAALMNLFQQMLQERADMNRYLTQSRMMWSGELAGNAAVQPSDAENARPAQTPAAQPVTTQPATSPPSTNQSSTNQAAPTSQRSRNQPGRTLPPPNTQASSGQSR